MKKRFTVVTTIVLCTLMSVAAQQQSGTKISPPITFGNPSASQRLEVFYDLQCPSCVPFHYGLKKLMDRSPEKVYVIFRHFPLTMHENAFTASSVVEAAKKQGKGLEMISLLLQEQSKWSSAKNPYPMMFRYAERLGLDIKMLQKDAISDEVILGIVLDMNRARQLEVVSTPTTFLNGRMLPYSESLELEKIISQGN